MNIPGTHSLKRPHPARPDAIEVSFPDQIGDGGPEDDSLAEIMRVLYADLQAGGLIVHWHPADDEPVTLFAAGRCRSERSCLRLAAEFASGLADKATDSGQPLTRERTGGDFEMAALAFPSDGGVATVTTLSEIGAASANADCRPRLVSLLPVLRPFLRLWMAGREQRLRVAGLTCAVDNCDVAMFIVDRRSSVLFANRAAKRHLERQDGISLARGRLACTSLSDTLRLQAAIDHVCADDQPGVTVMPIVALQRRQGRPLMTTLVPVPQVSGAQPGGAAVLYAFDPEEDLTRLIEPACSLYGLSAGEARLTCRLAAGGTLAEAAKALGVQEQTARSYLKQIFLKTQTNRQAELVWLMLKSAVRVINTSRMRVF